MPRDAASASSSRSRRTRRPASGAARPRTSAAGSARASTSSPPTAPATRLGLDPRLELDPGHLDRHAHAHRRAVVVVHLDRTLELARHERLHDREAEPARPLERELVGQPGAVVAHLDLDVTVGRGRASPRPARRARAFRERVVDRVLHELVEHDRERRRDLARQLARVAFDLEADRVLGRRRGVLDEPGERPHDLVERHDVARLARQRLVHDRDRADPPLRLRQRGPRLGRLQPPALEPQQRRDRLQVVLHPVVDLADRRVLRQQHAVAAPEVADVAQQDERARGLSSDRPAAAPARAPRRRRARSPRRPGGAGASRSAPRCRRSRRR